MERKGGDSQTAIWKGDPKNLEVQQYLLTSGKFGFTTITMSLIRSHSLTRTSSCMCLPYAWNVLSTVQSYWWTIHFIVFERGITN